MDYNFGWKKKNIYTVIDFKDKIGPKLVVLDFGKQIEPLIHHRMLDSRKDKL